MWYDNPLISGFLVALIAGVSALVVAWVNKSRASMDAKSKEEVASAEVRIAESKRDLAVVELERLAAEGKRSALLIEQMATEQTKMAVTLEATHIATNSAKTLLDSQLAAARAEVEQARQNYMALERLAAAEKALLKEENRTLQNQLQTLALSMPAQQAQSLLHQSPQQTGDA